MINLRCLRVVLLAIAVCGSFMPSGAHAVLSADRGLYAIDETTNNFYRINTTTGAATLVGPLGETMRDSGGLAFDAASGRLYVSDISMSGGTTAGLGRISLTTGAVTTIGDSGSGYWISGLAYDSVNDVLYGADQLMHHLVSINRSTGAASSIGDFSGTTIVGLAYCPANDTLYGINVTNVYTINRATGEPTEIGPHGMPSGSITMAYDENSGKLFAASHNVNNLYAINMATGASSLVGATGIEVGGLASVPSQGALSVLYINTLSDDSDFVDGLEGMDIDGLSVVKANQITPMTDYLQDFDVVLVASNDSFIDGTALGDDLADYVDAGGGLGLFEAALTSGGNWALGGRILASGYAPLALTNIVTTVDAREATSFVSHDITNGVTALSTWRTTLYTATQGAGQSLGVYEGGYLLGAYNDTRPIAVINVQPSNGNWAGDLILMTENLINWCENNSTPSTTGGSGGGCFISNLMID